MFLNSSIVRCIQMMATKRVSGGMRFELVRQYACFVPHRLPNKKNIISRTATTIGCSRGNGREEKNTPKASCAYFFKVATIILHSVDPLRTHQQIDIHNAQQGHTIPYTPYTPLHLQMNLNLWGTILLRLRRPRFHLNKIESGTVAKLALN